jgi:hypothetical protein
VALSPYRRYGEKLHRRRAGRAKAAAAQDTERERGTVRERDQATAETARARAWIAAALDSDGKDHDVYPDTVVHRRSGLSAENDLLVVEVKKENDGHEDDRDVHGESVLLPALLVVGRERVIWAARTRWRPVKGAAWSFGTFAKLRGTISLSPAGSCCAEHANRGAVATRRPVSRRWL